MSKQSHSRNLISFEDDLAEAFFSQPPPPGEVTEDFRDHGMGQRERLAMVLSVSAVGVALVVAVGLVMMPRRAIEVGHATLSMPAFEPAPRAREVVPEPADALPSSSAALGAVADDAAPEAEADAAEAEAAEADAEAAGPPAQEVTEARAMTAPSRQSQRPARQNAKRRNGGRRATLTQRAYRAQARGDHRRAAALARRAIALDASDAGAYIALGGALDARGDVAGAQRAFRSCVARASGGLVDGCRSLLR